jgi:hypothetical protein
VNDGVFGRLKMFMRGKLTGLERIKTFLPRGKNFPSNLTFCAPKVPKLLLIGGILGECPKPTSETLTD